MPWPFQEATARLDQEARPSTRELCVLVPTWPSTFHCGTGDERRVQGSETQPAGCWGLGQGPGEGPVGRQAGAGGSACVLPSKAHRAQGCDSAPRPAPVMGTGPRLLGCRQKTTLIGAPDAPGAGAGGSPGLRGPRPPSSSGGFEVDHFHGP